METKPLTVPLFLPGTLAHFRTSESSCVTFSLGSLRTHAFQIPSKSKGRGVAARSHTHQCHNVIGQVSGKIWGDKTGQAGQRHTGVILAGATQVLEGEGAREG